MAVGEQLPEPLSGELLDAARDAFTHGLQAAALTSAAIAAGAALLAIVLLRRVGAESLKESHAVPVPEQAADPAQH